MKKIYLLKILTCFLMIIFSSKISIAAGLSQAISSGIFSMQEKNAVSDNENKVPTLADIASDINIVKATSITGVTADFDAITDTVSLVVYYTDKSSSNVSGWLWSYGDGKFLSDTIRKNSDYHRFDKAGIYDMCLIAGDIKTYVTDKKCKELHVGNVPCRISTDFSYTNNGNTINFTDKSTGNIANWYWNFGDDSTSTVANPSHAFRKAGVYLVSLSISDAAMKCTDYYSDLVNVGDPKCVANFNYFINLMQAIFTNSSDGVSSYYWDFNDGTYATTNNVIHNFKNFGLYKVSLTVSNADLSCVDNSIVEIQVGFNDVSCNAKFTYFVDSTTAVFTDKVSGESTNLLWSFGDGSTSSSHNPIHKYKAQGYYTVGMNTYNSNNKCMDFHQETILVGKEGIDCEADFLYTFDPTVSKNVLFSDNSKGDLNKWIWNFGDGNISNVQNPSHKFNEGGYYNVCLTVVNKKDIPNISCKEVAIATTAVNNCEANFEFNVDSTSKKAAFSDVSLGSPYKWEWGFGDKALSTEKQPTHVYTSPGYYLVSLKITTASGCSDMTYKLLNVSMYNTLKVAFGCDKDITNSKAGGYPVDFVGAGLGDQSRLKWTFDDGSIDSTSTTPTHVYEKDGTYHVCYEISDPITGAKADTCQTITVNSTDNVKNILSIDFNLNAFPNPFTDYINIEYSLKKENFIELSAYDINGRKLSTLISTLKPAGKFTLNWNTAEFSSGVYYLQLRTSDGNQTKKMIIKR